jgi:hypothetical protein
MNANAFLYRVGYDRQFVANEKTSIFQGVIGTFMVTNKGVPIKWTPDNATTALSMIAKLW